MVDTTDKAFRHPEAGRIYPGRAFAANNIQYPANWLEHASEQDLAHHRITVSDDDTMTPEDLEQEALRQSKQELRERMTAQQFEYLGRFGQAFERMVDAARTGCIRLHSSTAHQQQLRSIIFHHKAMGAESLFAILRATVAQITSDEERASIIAAGEEAKAALAQVQAAYKKMCETRNELLHGTWSVGWYSQTDELDFNMPYIKGHVSGKGLDFDNTARSIDKLREDISTCEKAEQAILRAVSKFFWDCSKQPTSTAP